LGSSVGPPPAKTHWQPEHEAISHEAISHEAISIDGTLKALFVTHYPFFGGPQNHIMRLRQPLAERGWEAIALLPDDEGNAVERLRSEGVRVLAMPLHRLRKSKAGSAKMLATLPGEVAAIRRIIRQEGIDVVVVLGLANPHAAIAARLEDVAVIWELHDTVPPPLLRTALMLPVRLLADVVLASGHAVADGHPGSRSFGSRLITGIHTLDATAFRPETEARCRARELLGFPLDALVVGTIANLSPQKGLADFVHAAEIVDDNLPGVCFALLGAEMPSQLEYAREIHGLATATRAAAEGRFVLRDPGSSVPLYLQAFDVFLMTSAARSEGLPATILEAMSSGLPVVATDVGSISDVVEEEITGCLVPPHDPQAAAEAVIRLLRNPKLRASMAVEARERAETRYDLQVFAGTMQAALDAAMTHRGGSRRNPSAVDLEEARTTVKTMDAGRSE
jgi:glycosyltransferase involved in cell wall biosynthesis